jgi:hypothetical protein
LFHWFFVYFGVDPSPVLHYFFLTAALGLVCSCFSQNLRYIIRLFIWEVNFFLMWALMAINFALLVCPTDSGRVYFHFHFILGTFLISSLTTLVTHWIFRSVLFSLDVFEYFLVFILLLRTTFILLWSDMIQGLLQFSWIIETCFVS